MNTNFWKEDKIFELLPDARYFYLCLLTNPERNTTAAFKCSDRLMVAFTGYNPDTIKLCRKELIKKHLIEFVDDFYIINDQDNVKARTGKLTPQLFKKDFDSLPLKVQELLQSRSGAVPEYKDSDINSDSNVDKKEKKVDEVAKLYYETVKELKLPIRNHNNLKSRITALEKEVGKDFAVAYLTFVKENYNQLEDDGFKPRINESLDIHAKRVSIKSWIERRMLEQNKPATTGGRPII